jgi:3-hydroxyisobutyrate dehydrogenase-like beta-hydroxyacid dehydrogenase
MGEPASTKETIGLVGAGVMGSVVGARIVEAGYGLKVYDPAPKVAQWAAEVGAKVVATPGDTADGTTIILTFLPGPAQVEAVICGAEGLRERGHAGQVIVDHATSSPENAVRMTAALSEKDMAYLDAPVLGRPSAVGKWALPVGGDAIQLERCRPVFDLFADKVFHIGPAGSGHTIKLLNQMMFGAINAMTAEMMAVADKMGIEPRRVYDVITASQAGTVSNLFKELGGRIAADDYDNPTFIVDLLIKDVNLGLEMARKNGAPPLMGRTVAFLNEMAEAKGYGSQDTAVMWKAVRQLWNGNE